MANGGKEGREGGRKEGRAERREGRKRALYSPALGALRLRIMK